MSSYKKINKEDYAALVEGAYTVEEWDIAKNIADTYYGPTAVELITHTTQMYDDQGYFPYVADITVLDELQNRVQLDFTLPPFYAIESVIQRHRGSIEYTYRNDGPFDRDRPIYADYNVAFYEYVAPLLESFPPRSISFDLTRRIPKEVPVIYVLD